MSPAYFRTVRITVATLTLLIASLPAFSKSQVRIVRLSYISGGVEIDRSGRGYEKAMTNLPIAEGAKIQSQDYGRAEVEFEDGSTIRLVPNSAIEFRELSLSDSGSKVSAVEITKGTAYVDFAGTKGDEFSMRFGQEKIQLTHSAHLRVGVGDTESTVAVFKGDIQIDGPSGALAVRKNQTASFDLSDNDRSTLAKNIDQESFDAWDKQQAEYHSRYASNSYQSYSPYAYGTTDLAYYGNFFNAPGYGMMWQPYFVGMGWDPFMDGAWAFSPGWGFGWVSAYPWGWTPYHYGTWVFLPSYGWAWQPGGVWTTWYTQPVIMNAPNGFKPPRVPSTGTSTVVVNRGSGSTFTSGSKVVLRSNSAGLGVPRGEVNNLAKASQQVQQRGSVTEHVHAAPVAVMPSPPRTQAPSDRNQPSIGSRASQPMPRESSPPPSHSSSPPSSHSSSPPPSAGIPHR